MDEGADEGGLSGSGRIMLKGKEIEDDEEVEKEKWKKTDLGPQKVFIHHYLIAFAYS